MRLAWLGILDGVEVTPMQRLGLVAPELGRKLLKTVLMLPPDSRIRRAGMRQLVQQAYEAFNRRDWESVVSLLSPDAEHRFWPEGPEGGAPAFLDMELQVRGRESVRSQFEGWLEAWDTFNVIPQEIRDFGDCLLVVTRMQARGRGSEVAMDQPGADIFWFRDGWCVRWHTYMAEADAVQALGG